MLNRSYEPGTPAANGMVARTMGTAPRIPAQPMNSCSRHRRPNHTAHTASGGKGRGNQYQVGMTATVSLNTGKPAVGTVASYLNGVVVAQAQVGANGTASVTVAAAKGSAQVRAQFTPADTANHLGSTSPTVTVNVK